MATPPTPTEIQQHLRMRRVFLSAAIYAPCALMLVLVGWLGFFPAWFTAAWVATFACANAAFLALIKTGANLRFKDPSMTMAQMAVAIFAVAWMLYHAGAIRGGLLMLLVVIILFGIFRLTTREVLWMGALCALGYAAVIVLLTLHRPEEVNARVEWVQWLALCLTLAVLCPVVGYMSQTRRRLSESLRTIREIAQRDALTGMFNRLHMGETLDREIARCERSCPAFLTLIADIDHFKRVNDTLGHLVGDAVLRAVADTMRDALRKADYMARYGGEEFVLIIAAQDEAEGRAASERIRAAVERLHLAQLAPGGVTVSIGGTFYRAGDAQSAILARADAALYRAKHGGRNRVVIDSPPPAPPAA